MTKSCTAVPADEVRLDPILGLSIGVLGYGAQGQAHALNLRDSGCRVIVAQRPGTRFEAAIGDGFAPVSIEEAVATADLLISGLPDDAVGGIYAREIQPHLNPEKTLGFMHGFVIHYQLITPPPDVDVILLAPKAQGRGVRNEFLAGRGVYALMGVHQNPTGRARQTALGWAAGIGAQHAGVLETTFADETETDLFGEQAVLCGGMTALIKAGFETLVEAGYPAELAYFECCHEIKLLADLIYEGGITSMREKISSTARFGDLTRGPRIAGEALRMELRAMLDEIRDGRYALEFLEDVRSGRKKMTGLLEKDREHPLERAGRALRTRRP